MTRSPRSASAETRCRPTYPSPPVTRTAPAIRSPRFGSSRRSDEDLTDERLCVGRAQERDRGRDPSGMPTRPSGMSSPYRRAISSWETPASSASTSSWGVSVTPGAIAFTDTPLAPTARAALFTRLIRPPFEAAYAVAFGQPITPHSEAITTILPNPRSAIPGRTALDQHPRAEEIHVEDAPPVLGRLLLERGHRHERVVGHEELDGPEPALDVGDARLDRVRFGDVEGDRDRLPPPPRSPPPSRRSDRSRPPSLPRWRAAPRSPAPSPGRRR